MMCKTRETNIKNEVKELSSRLNNLLDEQKYLYASIKCNDFFIEGIEFECVFGLQETSIELLSTMCLESCCKFNIDTLKSIKWLQDDIVALTFENTLLTISVYD